MVLIEAICRDANNLYIARLEVFGTARNFGKLSRAHGGEITGVREQDGLRVHLVSGYATKNGEKRETYPRVPDPLMELASALDQRASGKEVFQHTP